MLPFALLLHCVQLPASRPLQADEAPSADSRLKKGYEALRPRPTDPKSDVLEMEIPRFRVKDAPLGFVCYALHHIGVDICCEQALRHNDLWYVDGDGVALFSADKLISLDLRNTQVSRVMDRIVELDSRYRWERIAGTEVINLLPRKSRLGFEVGPIDFAGKPYDLLAQFEGKPESRVLVPGLIRGQNNLPEIKLKTGQVSARELLNAIVRQHPGMVWNFVGAPSINYLPKTWATAKQVELVYPDVRIGLPTSDAAQYVITEKRIEGVETVVVERRPRTPQK
jgi:hypothetical protein